MSNFIWGLFDSPFVSREKSSELAFILDKGSNCPSWSSKSWTPRVPKIAYALASPLRFVNRVKYAKVLFGSWCEHNRVNLSWKWEKLTGLGNVRKVFHLKQSWRLALLLANLVTLPFLLAGKKQNNKNRQNWPTHGIRRFDGGLNQVDWRH